MLIFFFARVRYNVHDRSSVTYIEDDFAFRYVLICRSVNSRALVTDPCSQFNDVRKKG